MVLPSSRITPAPTRGSTVKSNQFNMDGLRSFEHVLKLNRMKPFVDPTAPQQLLV